MNGEGEEIPAMNIHEGSAIETMIIEYGTSWTRRLYQAVRVGREEWLQAIKTVKESCKKCRYLIGTQEVEQDQAGVTRAINAFVRDVVRYNNAVQEVIIHKDQSIHREICLYMFQSILIPFVTEYDLRPVYSDFVQELIFVSLPCVCIAISRLFVPRKINDSNLELFASKIQVLTALETFHFEHGCTNLVTAKIALYCCRLKEVCLRFSKRVDDECVDDLLRLRALEILDISGTSISDEGYSKLLSGLPRIQNIVWPGCMDSVLASVTLDKIHSLQRFSGEISDPLLIANICPNITHLTLSGVKCNLTPLKELDKLVHLSLKNCNYRDVCLSELLEAIGRHLVTLELIGISKINTTSLINNLPLLEKLKLSSSELLPLNQNTFNPAAPHFINVKEIKLHSVMGNIKLNEVLTWYNDLHIFHAFSVDSIDDSLVHYLVRCGVLQNASMLIVDDCQRLSFEAIRCVIENCKCLTYLGNLGMLPSISKDEIGELKLLAQEKRPSLEIRIVRDPEISIF
ncbi:uncharacterized protein [Periplaneta americana]|uniref:uncharacterized protein n=1 Tax=Periplaneta americana TaxID=6978 RepID=UPI0037E9C56C